MNKERSVFGFFVANSSYAVGDIIKNGVSGVYVNKNTIPKKLLTPGLTIVEVEVPYKGTHSWSKHGPKLFCLSVKSGAKVVSTEAVPEEKKAEAA